MPTVCASQKATKNKKRIRRLTLYAPHTSWQCVFVFFLLWFNCCWWLFRVNRAVYGGLSRHRFNAWKLVPWIMIPNFVEWRNMHIIQSIWRLAEFVWVSWWNVIKTIKLCKMIRSQPKPSWKIKLTPFGAFEFSKKNREDIKKTNLDD